MAGWLLPFVFLLAIPIGVAWGQRVVVVLPAHGGPHNGCARSNMFKDKSYNLQEAEMWLPRWMLRIT